MSQSMFEIRRVFQTNRVEICKAAEGKHSIQNAVREYGAEQLIDNLRNMLDKEAGRGSRRHAANMQHNPVDYLSHNFGGKIKPEIREEAVLSILQFGVQTNCLDQTILQAVLLADNYLRFNQSCQPAFMRIIYAMALEISIKLNEQMVLSLEDIEALFEGRFNQKMLINLERHILTLNNFRVNVATPLDFVLNFVYMEQATLSKGSYQLTPDSIANETLYLLHYAMSSYAISRKKNSSIAVAAICHVLQEVHEDCQASQQNGPDGEQLYLQNQPSEMQRLRDMFLDKILQRFPELDQDEIYEILSLFKEPYIEFATRQNEYVSVTAPWTFERLDVNRIDASMASEALQIGLQPSLPNMARLSLENKDQQVEGNQQPKQTEVTDGDMVFSTADTSVQGTQRDPRHNLHMDSQSSSMGGLEENKSARGGNLSRRERLDPPEYPPQALGRPSLSESTGAPSKNFSPQFDKMSSHTKKNQPHGDDENLLDDDDQSQPPCSRFIQSSSNRTFTGGGGRLPSTQQVDGVFQVIQQDVESAMDDVGNSAFANDDGGGSDSEEELTYNSQGKPVPRKKIGAGDKKQSRKVIQKPAKQKKPDKADLVKPQKHAPLM